MKVLIVAAAAMRRDGIQHYLQQAGYETEAVQTLAAAEARLAKGHYGFVLVAQALPDGDVLALLRRQAQSADQPASFIWLTRSDSVEARLQGFAAGADDCMTQSVDPIELERRMRTIARQRFGRQRTQISFGPGFVLDLGARLLRHGTESVNLSRSQFDLLHYLLRHRGRPLTRQQLGAHIGKEGEDSNFIDVHIMNVRKSLARFAPPDFLQTVRGIGYQAA